MIRPLMPARTKYALFLSRYAGWLIIEQKRFYYTHYVAGQEGETTSESSA